MKVWMYLLRFLLVLTPFSLAKASDDTDLKNALPDLLHQYQTAESDIDKANSALLIANFYLNNKSYNLFLDSSLHYTQVAQKLSRGISYNKGVDDALVLQAKIWIEKKKVPKITELTKNATGSLKVRLHILLGLYWLEKPGSDKEDMNQANTEFSLARSTALKARMPTLATLAEIYQFKLLKENQCDSTLCAQKFNSVINRSLRLRKPGLLAKAWIERSNHCYTIPDRVNLLKTALSYSKGLPNQGTAIWIKKELADMNLQEGKLDSAEQKLLEVVKLYKLAGYKNLQFTYDLLIAVYNNKGQYKKAMFYGIAAEKCAEFTGTDKGLDHFYYNIYQTCEYLGQKALASEYLKKSIAETAKSPNYFPYGLYRGVLWENIRSGKAKSGLDELKKTIKLHPPLPSDELFIATLFSDCYVALNKLDVAEKYHDQIAGKVKNLRKDYSYYQWCRWVIPFYMARGKYYKAKPFLAELLNAPPGINPQGEVAVAHFNQFKIDSAEGRYLDAIKHSNTGHKILDSISNADKVKQSAELRLQYQTEKKEKENLKLRNRNHVQQSEIERSSLEKKLIGTGLFASFIIVGLMLYLYRAKQHSNNVLKVQQNEIQSQNRQLNQLVGEKEWLIKEIHHRVKNNLQIISSLLNTQSAYLNNEEAKTAIRDSQNRMQAISIVHQKLYQSNDLATVEFKLYLEELVQSICDSFRSKLNVKFKFDVIEAYLSTAESVPIGLMLNEAITNSIKYAFAQTQYPQITVSLARAADGMYILTIKDNGQGLPEDFDMYNCTSLGINLMVGLTEQLGGTFSINSNHGTIITIVFPPFLHGAE
ncbi:tetratricopeptide repeat-containing sensor histidine kinase [Mucilaginibacter terrae]|nr:histidine kinase dimerization/phosphoacceptor domain -containing protein [Mucilaginibacter terrae]